MKKQLLVFMLTIIGCSLLFSRTSVAQQSYNNLTTTTATTGSTINQLTGAIAYHQVTWTLTGTISTCTVSIDSSPDGATWTVGGVITGQSCTSNGQSSIANGVYNYIRINVSTFTGTSPVINAVYTGYTTNPKPTPSGSVTAPTSLTATAIPVATGTGTIANSLLRDSGGALDYTGSQGFKWGSGSQPQLTSSGEIYYNSSGSTPPATVGTILKTASTTVNSLQGSLLIDNGSLLNYTGTSGFALATNAIFTIGSGTLSYGGNVWAFTGSTPQTLQVSGVQAARLYGAGYTPTPTCNSSIVATRIVVADATVAALGSAYVGSGPYTIGAECIYNSSTSTYSWIID